MSIDARLSTGLPAHPKTKKLIRRVGEGGAWALVCLVLWARANRPDGDLSGMTGEDIELAVDWRGEADALVTALVAVGFLDGTDGTYQLHDWAEHQPWSAGSEHRSDRAKWAALCRREGRESAAAKMPEYAAKLANSSAKPAKSTDEPANSSDLDQLDSANSNKSPAPSPIPSPSPSPSPRAEADSPNGLSVAGKPPTPDCPHADIVALYHEILPELRRVREWTPDRQAFLRSRWREKPVRQNLDWWRKFFGYVRECPWLMGEGLAQEGRPPFTADLEWLVRPTNFRKVIEGKYQRRAA